MRRNAILDDATDGLLVRLSGELQLDYTQTISEALRQLARRKFPHRRVGHIKIDILSGDPEQQCSECDRMLNGSGWLVLYSDDTTSAPVCDRCASSVKAAVSSVA